MSKSKKSKKKRGSGSFKEALNSEQLAQFNEICNLTFGEQAQQFLNIYWDDYGSERKYIFFVVWELIKKQEMDANAIELLCHYKEGCSLQFDVAIAFYENIYRIWDNPSDNRFRRIDNPNGEYTSGEYKDKSHPGEHLTSIKLKEKIRKIDANSDNHISMLEFLLGNYNASPADFAQRLLDMGDEPEAIRLARENLRKVTEALNKYEQKCEKLKKKRDKAKAKGKKTEEKKWENELMNVEQSNEFKELDKQFIDCEARLRIARRIVRGQLNMSGATPTSSALERSPKSGPSCRGTVWWCEQELKILKARGGRGKGKKKKK